MGLPCQPVPHNPAERQQTFPTPPRRERWLERLNTKRNTVILDEWVERPENSHEFSRCSVGLQIEQTLNHHQNSYREDEGQTG